jgi:hypothetical protein
VPLIPTSSFLDEQREIFRAEFQPVEVFTGLPDETYAALVDILADTPGEDILVAIVTAGPISWYAAPASDDLATRSRPTRSFS